MPRGVRVLRRLARAPGGGPPSRRRTTSSIGGALAGGRSASGFSMACTSSRTPSPRRGVERLPHRRQGRIHVGKDRVVVEPDDADIVRYAPARLPPERGIQADGHCRRPAANTAVTQVSEASSRPAAYPDAADQSALNDRRSAPSPAPRGAACHPLETVPGGVPPLRTGEMMNGLRDPDPADGRWPPAPADRHRPLRSTVRGTAKTGGAPEKEDRHVVDTDRNLSVIDGLGDDDAVHALIEGVNPRRWRCLSARLPSC